MYGGRTLPFVSWSCSVLVLSLALVLYLAKTSRKGRLLRSGKNSHKSSTENHETSYRHPLSSLSGFLMVICWFSEKKLRKKQKRAASEL